MEHLIPAEFNGTPLSIIDRDGQKWLTAEEVGHCLGYDESNARKGVVKLFERHGDEFTDADSRVVNLTSRDGKPRPTRIFSAEGCVMLGMFSNTPRAKEFRQWAKRVLAGQPVAVAQAAAVDLNLAREIGQLKDMVNAQNQVIIGLYQRIDTAQRGQIRAVTSLLALQKRQAAADAKALVIELASAGIERSEIARRTGKTLNHIRQILFNERHGEQGDQAEGRRTAEGWSREAGCGVAAQLALGGAA